MIGSLAKCHDTTPLPVEGVVRIVRAVEMEAEQALVSGELIYIRGPRKSGKTSLARRLEHRISGGLDGIDARLTTRLVLTNANQYKAPDALCAIVEDQEEKAFKALAERARLGLERTEALRRRVAGEGWFWRAAEAVAAESAVPVVVFVDEIEEILGEHRTFGEGWLVRLREEHQNAEGRLGVCVLGQLPAGLLVRAAERTPFNTAKELVLPDFDQHQVQEMVKSALDTSFEGTDLSPLLARVIFREFGGQPNLTQCLLGKLQGAAEQRADAVADHAGIIRDFIQDDPECQPSTSNTYMAVDAAFRDIGVWPAKEGLETYALMLENARRTGGDALPMVIYDPWNDGHRMLEAIGLAKVEVRLEGADRYLVARNRVARRIFDQDWVDRRRLGLPAADASSAATVSSTLAAMERLAKTEICGSEWALKHQARITEGSGREIVEGALFEFELVRQAPTERLTLQMFKGVGLFGRRLWRHQVRTLRQLVDRAASLPNIYRGSDLPDHGVAYVITQRPSLSLAEPGVYDFLRERKSWAIDQFASLADGLDCLAEEGIVHRNIWPGSIRFDSPAPGERPAQLKLDGFEFSVMLRSALGTGDDPMQVVGERRAALQRAFLRQAPQSRPYAPPEFMAGLFGDENDPVPTTVTSGVFSLGMVVTSWFISLPDVEAFAGVLRQYGECAEYSRAEHAAYVAAVDGAIHQSVRSHHLSAVLGRLLREMIALEPQGRPTPREVLEELRANAATLRAWTSGERKPLLACYSYRHTAERLASVGMITSAPGSEDSRRHVEDFLERELRNATLFFAPRGIGPYVDDPQLEQYAAQWVLKGQSWLFYCQRYERRERGLGAAVQTPHILRIAYPWPLNQVWRGLPTETVPLREFGPLAVVEQRGSPEMDRANDAKYQNWGAALSAATRNIPPPSFEIAKTAFSWVVEVQKEVFELQRFPLKAISPSHDRSRKYELDVVEYRRWISASSLRAAVFQASNITDPRDHFEQVMQEAWAQGDRQIRLRVRATEDARPRRWSTAQVDEVLASHISISGVSLPEKAQIELRSASLGRLPLEQQSAAIEELSAAPALFDQLLRPHVIIDEEALDDSRIDEAVEHLAGRAREIVRKIVSSAPLVALQGPPGTGKTTVTAAVVDSLLLRDRTERILITSQSHAAVDNIALRILESGIAERSNAICVRVAADELFEGGDRINEQLKSWRPEAIAERLAARIRRECSTRLASGPEEGLRKAYLQLQQAATSGLLELADRIREGANLVFATTAGSRRVARDGFLRRGKFDLAVVDEASKAWPTEIIQPMLIADRQLLVGDHRQLQAFGSTTIERLLRQCIASNRDEFRIFANHAPAIQAWLKLFESFFSKGDNEKFVSAGENDRLLGWRDRNAVAEELDLQFRMRSDIADVVSRTFYGGKLKTDLSVNDRPRPPWLKVFADELGASRDILWIDTPSDGLFQSHSPVQNQDQARLSANLLRRASELQSGLDIAKAVVLSPYRRQNDEIRRQLAMHGGSSMLGNVHTVDSFQGREADLVILSLVRSPGTDREAGSAIERYGFMVQPERVNVMFSRAREFLIVLGDFEFFADAARIEKRVNSATNFDLLFWERLCGRILETGRLIKHEQLPDKLRVR